MFVIPCVYKFRLLSRVSINFDYFIIMLTMFKQVTGDDACVFIDVLLDDVDGEDGTEVGAAAAVESDERRGTVARRNRNMGKQELHYMNSMLIHLREDNKMIRNEMARVHERERRMLRLVNKNLCHLMRSPALMHGVRTARNMRSGPGYVPFLFCFRFKKCILTLYCLDIQ